MSTSFARVPRRMLAGLMAVALPLTGIALSATSASAATSNRVAGENRYATAAEIATATFPDGVTDVILATGENFPDALAAAGIAGQGDAPVLLTSSDSLSPETEAALETLAPNTVHIAGGTMAVSGHIEDALDDAGYDTPRFAGEDRYETAALIAEAIGADNIAGDTAIVATGTNFPDALAGGPLAYAGPHPILLVADEVPQATEGALTDLGISEVIILGETSAVSAEVETELESITGDDEVTRLGGPSRYETAAEIADYAVANAGFDLSTVLIANGVQNLGVDALAGGPHGGELMSPVLLVTEDSVPAGTEAFLRTNAAAIDVVRALGGPTVINDATLAAAVAAVKAGVTEAEQGPIDPDTDIVDVDKDSDDIVTDDAIYSYDSNDQFFIDQDGDDTIDPGEQVTLAEFEAELSDGDELDGEFYQSNTEFESRFLLDDLAPAAPAVNASQTAGSEGTSVTLSITAPGTGKPDSYIVYRADGACPATVDPEGDDSFTQVTTLDDDETEYVATGLDASTQHCFAVTAVQDGDESAAASDDVTTAAAPTMDTTGPTAVDTVLTDDNGFAGVMDNGDVFKVVFNEDVAAPEAGDTLRVEDGNGTTADVVNGTNATFNLNDAAETVNGTEYPVGRVLTVTMGAAPTIVAEGTEAGVQYDFTIINSSGVTDHDGNRFEIGGSDDVVIDNEAGIPDTTAPEFFYGTATAGGNDAKLTYTEVLDCTTVEADGSDYDVTYTPADGTARSITPSSATCSGDTVTLTFPGEPFASRDRTVVDPLAEQVFDPANNAQPADNTITISTA